MKDLNSLDWENCYSALNDKGYAHLPGILSKDECDAFSNAYAHEKLYRSVISMARYRFGLGEYKYFNYPLPPLLSELRTNFYRKLQPIANRWMNVLGIDLEYPSDHRALVEHCHQKDQKRPTPLILRYEKDGFNTLHQDLYGDIYFPFQVVFVLSQKGKDHEGGELVFVEQIPRAQSRAEIVAADQGDAIIFTTNFRPVNGTRGYYRAKMKHGVSPVRSGVRYALGLIFHDAA
jgi:uncharacterized protein